MEKMIRYRYNRLRVLIKLQVRGLISFDEYVIESEKLRNEIYFLESLI